MIKEYFDLIEDSDLDDTEPVQGWVWICPTCLALFRSKAIHNRTIFPFFGYHPADGNCKVIKDETAELIRLRAYSCKCKESIKRVRSVKILENAIKSHYK